VPVVPNVLLETCDIDTHALECTNNTRLDGDARNTDNDAVDNWNSDLLAEWVLPNVLYSRSFLWIDV